MARLIDADALKDVMRMRRDLYGAEYEERRAELDQVISDINSQPTVDAEPVRHGRWIDPQPEGCMTWDKRAYQQCSICGDKQYLSQSMIYCPNCGARMDGDGDG